MNIIEFVKSLFAKRNEHVESVKELDKKIAKVLDKAEAPKPKKVKKPQPKKKTNGSK
jgi:hypothetical protein